MGKNANQISTKLEAHVVGGVNPGSMSERERMRGLKKSYCPHAGVAINANVRAHYTGDNMCVRYEDISKVMPTTGSGGTLKGYYNVKVYFMTPIGTTFYGSSYDIFFGQHYSGGLNNTQSINVTTSQAILIEGYEANLINITCSNLQYKITSSGSVKVPRNAYLYYYINASGSKYDTLTIGTGGTLNVNVTMSNIDEGYKIYGENPEGSGTQADPYLIVLHIKVEL